MLLIFVSHLAYPVERKIFGSLAALQNLLCTKMKPNWKGRLWVGIFSFHSKNKKGVVLLGFILNLPLLISKGFMVF